MIPSGQAGKRNGNAATRSRQNGFRSKFSNRTTVWDERKKQKKREKRRRGETDKSHKLEVTRDKEEPKES